MVARCIGESLVIGQRIAIAASLFEADANNQSSAPNGEQDASTINPTDARRAVREYLGTLDEEAFGSGQMLGCLVDGKIDHP